MNGVITNSDYKRINKTIDKYILKLYENELKFMIEKRMNDKNFIIRNVEEIINFQCIKYSIDYPFENNNGFIAIKYNLIKKRLSELIYLTPNGLRIRAFSMRRVKYET